MEARTLRRVELMVQHLTGGASHGKAVQVSAAPCLNYLAPEANRCENSFPEQPSFVKYLHVFEQSKSNCANYPEGYKCCCVPEEALKGNDSLSDNDDMKSLMMP